MKEYIERMAAIEAFDDSAVERNYGDVCPESVIRVIEQIPAADVQPVVRGKWITEYEPDGKPYCLHCSVCDDDFSIIGITTASNFCPNCGADMREINDETT